MCCLSPLFLWSAAWSHHYFLYNVLQGCTQAFHSGNISKTNMLSCTPGTEGLTGKSGFIDTLKHAYGASGSATIMPAAFLLPSQHSELKSHLRSTDYAGNWALKEAVHRGKGVIAVPGDKVADKSLEMTKQLRDRDWVLPPQYRFVLAQRFIDEQHFPVPDRPYVMRLWAVLGGGGGDSGVFRAFLYDGGLLVFGNPVENSTIDGNGKRTAQSLVVNLFQQDRVQALDPWTLETLRNHLRNTTGSDEAYDRLWDHLQRATAAALAAAVPGVRRETTRLRGYQGGNVEVLGIDFVVDSELRPWMIEVNYLPSMARKVIKCTPPGEKARPDAEPCRASAMDDEKEAFLSAHLHSIAARHQAVEAAAAAVETVVQTQPECSADTDKELLRQVLEAEATRHAAVSHGFADLTPLFYASLRCMAGDKEACTVALPPVTHPESKLRRSIVSLMLDAVDWIQTRIPLIIPFRVSWSENCLHVCLNRAPKPTKSQTLLQYRPLPVDHVMHAWLKRYPSASSLQEIASTSVGELCALVVGSGARAGESHAEEL
jgi:hypothetical protein